MDRWRWPDAFSKQVPSVLKAKQAISNYKKAVGDSAGLAELMVFYCEQASGFASDLGYQDESYLNALVRMFEQALIIATTLPASGRDSLVAGWIEFALPATSAATASETTWIPSLPSTPSAVSVSPNVGNLFPVRFTLHADLPKTHVSH